MISVADLHNIMRQAQKPTAMGANNGAAAHVTRSAMPDVTALPSATQGSIRDLFRTPDPHLLEAAQAVQSSENTAPNDQGASANPRIAEASLALDARNPLRDDPYARFNTRKRVQ